MKFLGNTYNPQDPNARMYVVRGLHETQQEAWQHYQEWLKGKIIGEPEASDTYTVEEMKAMGLVGVYLPAPADPDTEK